MRSLSSSEQQRAIEAVTWWCLHRFKGLPLDEKRLARLGFDSVDAMRIQLENWEVPEWLVGGENDSQQRKPRRGTGERVELPPAKEAIPLFKEMLEVLREAIEELEHRKEYFQDGRFVVETHIQDHAFDGGELVEFKGAFAGGGEQSPPEPLTSLIAIYVLAGLPLEPLLNTLHREPGDIDLDQLDLSIEGKRRKKGHTPGLKSKAKDVARLVRGGNLRPGAHTGEFSAVTHEAAWRLYRLQQQGLTSKEIEQKLMKQGFGRHDVAQLRQLGLLPPAL
jgi:hypothetical protein